jgi:hypothetical protein
MVKELSRKDSSFLCRFCVKHQTAHKVSILTTGVFFNLTV